MKVSSSQRDLYWRLVFTSAESRQAAVGDGGVEIRARELGGICLHHSLESIDHIVLPDLSLRTRYSQGIAFPGLSDKIYLTRFTAV